MTLILVASLSACRSDSSSGTDAGPGGGDGGGTPPLNIEVCAQELAAPTTGTCDVAPGNGTATVIHGDVLGEGVVYENGTVVYGGTEITCVGCDCGSTAGFADATILSCAGAAISPGLINPHDHITFTEGSPINTGAKRYDHRHDWRGELSTPSNDHGEDGVKWGELRMLMSGVTAIVGSGGTPGLVRNLDRLQSEDRDLGFVGVDNATFSLGDSNESFRADCGWNYSDTDTEVGEMDAFLPHVAEGINDYAAEEFKCQSTSFGDAEDFTESNAAHIHSIGLKAPDYFNMARDGAKIIWSPRSNIALYGMTAEVQTFHRLGGDIALGTDWTYSGSANMTRELACADEFNSNHLNSYFSDRDLFEMATVNAALATASDSLIGSLAVGKLADIAIYGGTGRYYRAVIGAENENVALVVSAGNPLYGDEPLMAGLGKSCDPLDVCGNAKTVCANEEYGQAYAGLQGSVTGAYPAFFCGLPTGEPTCHPSRPNEFTGNASDTDNDGDGIANESDNCPDVFNPIRPIDNGTQLDNDGDSTGNACDDTPLLADLDADGEDNLTDNCPFDSNADQGDSDSDSKGDVCDICPETANPDSICQEVVAPGEAATIAEVQDGTFEEDDRVAVTGSIVTAVSDSGFWMQDPTNNGTHAGVHVFTNSAPGVTIGDQVDIDGTIAEYFDDTQLTNAVVVNNGAGTPIVPVAVTVADAATEPYESMLVTLTDATVSNLDYDCAVDNAICMDSGLWEVNSSIVVYDRAYGDADWDARKGNIDITGVMSYRFDKRRIQPRVAADLVAP
ncbi:MAG: amidohydrolase family protein [Myxococcales bacterium]|nr:amidohydrolase family protein [Myxococcales bacterium]